MKKQIALVVGMMMLLLSSSAALANEPLDGCAVTAIHYEHTGSVAVTASCAGANIASAKLEKPDAAGEAMLDAVRYSRRSGGAYKLRIAIDGNNRITSITE